LELKNGLGFFTLFSVDAEISTFKLIVDEDPTSRAAASVVLYQVLWHC